MTHRLGQSVSIESQGDNRPTLRESLREAWQAKPTSADVTPSMMNTFGMMFHWAVTLFLFYTCMFEIIPTVCPSDDLADMRQFLRLLLVLVLTQVNVNWLLSAERRSQFVKETTIPGEDVAKFTAAGGLPLGYRVCSRCQLYAPPRSFHCSVCNACIMKRDHHCFFTGNCIGMTSQRRFIVLLFYIAIGGLLALILTACYLNHHMPFSDHYLAYVPFVALWRVVVGQSSLMQFVYVCQLYGCMIVVGVSSSFFCWQWLMVIRGQTSYEATRSIQTYRIGKLKSLYLVFGQLWWMNFIIPMPTTIPGNGVDWERRDQQKGQ